MSCDGALKIQSHTVECPDWKDTDVCGNGLNCWTLGFEGYFDFNLKGNFQVILINKDDGYVELTDKIKFKKGKVLLNTPNAHDAIELMKSVYPSFVAKIERGERNIDAIELVEIAEVYGQPIGFFLK